MVGAGPAGMMAAIRAAGLKQDVTLLEKNPRPGQKLLLSGKGRCNLTNACDLDSFIKRFSPNGEFLRDAFRKFFNRELINFFESRGLKLNIERQQRVFPDTSRSGSVLEALTKELEKNKVRILYNAKMKDILIQDNKIKGLLFENGKALTADRIILATGGVSFGFTGSTGEGMNIALRLGHSVIPLRPALVPLETKQKIAAGLKGLSLKNIRLTFSDGKKRIVSEIGELLFTHFGISGPLVLSFSGRAADWLKEKKGVFVEIDLKPALSGEQLDSRILREFKQNPKKNIKNVLQALLPKSLASVFTDIAAITTDKKVSQITQVERQKIVSLLKAWRLDILKTRPISEAMVTQGGISLKEINPRTMESRIIKGLYFAGEIIDLSADTGGFNLQAAFSTGYLAGESAALN